MIQIYAYINFNGNCREAMTFYKDCLDAELTLQIVGESPMAQQCPAAMQNRILHATLSKGSLLLIASDMVPPGGHIQGNNFSLSLNCSSEDEIRRFFEKLSAGGEIIDGLKVQFWGDLFCVFTDQFGIRWMLNYSQNQQQ